jgi:hypothetical protein
MLLREIHTDQCATVALPLDLGQIETPGWHIAKDTRSML